MRTHAAISLLRHVLHELRQRLLWVGILSLVLAVVSLNVRDTVGMAFVLLAFVVTAAVVWEAGAAAGRRERVP